MKALLVEDQATPKTRGRSKSKDASPAKSAEESPKKKQKVSTPKKVAAKAQTPARYSFPCITSSSCFFVASFWRKHSSRQSNGISDKGTHFLYLETFTIVFRQMFACRSSYGLIADHVGIFLQRWSPAKETWTPSQGEEVSGMCGCVDVEEPTIWRLVFCIEVLVALSRKGNCAWGLRFWAGGWNTHVALGAS